MLHLCNNHVDKFNYFRISGKGCKNIYTALLNTFLLRTYAMYFNIA